MKRKIISINEDKCDGCGICVPECHEGALQIIDGKARLISDLFCDGLGACIGFCPTGALTIEEREAESYDEKKVMNYIVKGGPNVIKAHLKHLKDHKEFEFLTEAIDYLNDNNITIPSLEEEIETKYTGSCPGSQERSIETVYNSGGEEGKRKSYLRQWPYLLSQHIIEIQICFLPQTAVVLHTRIFTKIF